MEDRRAEIRSSVDYGHAVRRFLLEIGRTLTDVSRVFSPSAFLNNCPEFDIRFAYHFTGGYGYQEVQELGAGQTADCNDPCFFFLQHLKNYKTGTGSLET